jgi:hypothetical protein
MGAILSSGDAYFTRWSHKVANNQFNFLKKTFLSKNSPSAGKSLFNQYPGLANSRPWVIIFLGLN